MRTMPANEGAVFAVALGLVALAVALWLCARGREPFTEALLGSAGSAMIDPSCAAETADGNTYRMQEFDSIMRHPSAPNTCYLRHQAGDGLLDASMSQCRPGSVFDEPGVVGDIGVAPVLGFDRCIIALQPGLDPGDYARYEARLRNAAYRRSPAFLQLNALLLDVETRMADAIRLRDELTAQLQSERDKYTAALQALETKTEEQRVAAAAAVTRRKEYEEVKGRFGLSVAAAAKHSESEALARSREAAQRTEVSRLTATVADLTKNLQALQSAVDSRTADIAQLQKAEQEVRQSMQTQVDTARQNLAQSVTDETRRGVMSANQHAMAVLSETRRTLGGTWMPEKRVGVAGQQVLRITTETRDACARACLVRPGCRAINWDADGSRQCALYSVAVDPRHEPTTAGWLSAPGEYRPS